MTPQQKIIEARKKKGYTQAQMAGFIQQNLSGQTYSMRQYQRLENGDFPKFKKEVIELVEDLLHIHIYDEIYDKKGKNNRDDNQSGKSDVDLNNALRIIEQNMLFLRQQYEERLSKIENILIEQKANLETAMVYQEAMITLLKAHMISTAKQKAGPDKKAILDEVERVSKVIFSTKV